MPNLISDKRSELAMYFTHIASLGNGKLILAGHLYKFENEKITRLIIFQNGQWEHLADLPEIVASILTIPKKEYTELYVLLRNGVIHKWMGAEHTVEIIDESRGLFFNDIRLIGKHLYACGTGQQVFRRSLTCWQPVDDGIFVGMNKPIRIFTSIDGISEQNIYTVGIGGAIYHFDGNVWSPIQSPTNYGLSKVLCLNNYTYIVGYHGLVIRGNIKEWEMLAYKKGEAMLIDIISFNSDIYLASEFAIYKVKDKTIEPLKNSVDRGFARFAIDRDYLWIIKEGSLLRYNDKWETFVFPENV